MKIHIVKQGDTLQSLSEKYRVGLEKIRAANPQLGDSFRVEAGQKVKIPSGPVTAQASQGAQSTPKTDLEAESYSPLAQPKPEAPKPAAQAQLPAVEAAEVKPQKLPASTAPAAAAKPEEAVQGLANKPELAKPETGYLPMAEQAPVMPYVTFMQMPDTNEQLPTSFKTADSSYSPLDVKLTGNLNDAVHPYAPIPTPTVEAGAFSQPFNTPAMFPQGTLPIFGTGAPGFPSFPPAGAIPGSSGMPSFHPVYPAYETQPQPGMMPEFGAMPPLGAMPGMPYSAGFPGVSGPSAISPFASGPVPFPAGGHDCGCGKGSHPPLPYSLPRSMGAFEQGAAVSGFSTRQAPTESVPEETLKTVDTTGNGTADSNIKAKVGVNTKKQAKAATRADALRKLLKKSKSQRKTARHQSRPWIYS